MGDSLSHTMNQLIVVLCVVCTVRLLEGVVVAIRLRHWKEFFQLLGGAAVWILMGSFFMFLVEYQRHQ